MACGRHSMESYKSWIVNKLFQNCLECKRIKTQIIHIIWYKLNGNRYGRVFYLFNLCICTSVIVLQKAMAKVVGKKSTNSMATKNLPLCLSYVYKVLLLFFVRRKNEFQWKNSRHDFRRQFTVLVHESRLHFHQDFNHSSVPWLFNSTVVNNDNSWKKSCNA